MSRISLMHSLIPKVAYEQTILVNTINKINQYVHGGLFFIMDINDIELLIVIFFFFSSRRRHTRSDRDWSSDVCSSDLEGLGEVVERADLERLHRRGDRRVARHHDDLDRLVVTLDLFEELEAVHVGHADVGDDCVEHVAAERLERLGGARRRRHLIAPLCEGFPEEPEDRGLVVNYQDLCGFHRLTDSDFTRRGVRLTSFS